MDLCSLFRRKPKVSQQVGGEAPSTEAYLFSYLRMLDTHGEGLPPDFVDALQRAVAHYGMTTLDRSPELEECLLWIYKSHQQVGAADSADSGGPATAAGRTEQPFGIRRRGLPYPAGPHGLDHSRSYFPAVSDLARELRYRCFEQPSFEQARKEIYAERWKTIWTISRRIRTLPDLHQRTARSGGLPATACQPACGPVCRLRRRLCGRLMLEVMTSRYYRAPADQLPHAIQSMGIVSYPRNTTRMAGDIHVFMRMREYPQLMQAMRALFPFLVKVPADEEIVLDFFTWKQEIRCPRRRDAEEIHSVINRAEFPRADPAHRRGRFGRWTAILGWASMQHFTYEPSEDGYEEVELFRGVHPMMAERLHLWRLKNFKIKRLPSVEDVYLVHAVANDNPKDERLFAVAEVRDLTPVRDKWGRIVQLPHLERMFTEAIAAIRQFQIEAFATRTAVLEPHLSLCVAGTQP